MRVGTSRRAKGTVRPIQTLVYLGEREEGEKGVWGLKFLEKRLQNQGVFIVKENDRIRKGNGRIGK